MSLPQITPRNAVVSETPAAISALRNRGDLAPLAAELLWQAGQGDDAARFLALALPAVARQIGAEFAALADLASGKPRVLAEWGPPRTVPWSAVTEALDRETAVVAEAWIAAPLVPHAASGEVLVVAVTHSTAREQAFARAATWRRAGRGAGRCARREAERRRIDRLEAILEIASQWNQTREVEPLLVQMAEAATRLLGADRASIFLWDRPNHTLVGRPALGRRRRRIAHSRRLAAWWAR